MAQQRQTHIKALSGPQAELNKVKNTLNRDIRKINKIKPKTL